MKLKITTIAVIAAILSASPAFAEETTATTSTVTPPVPSAAASRVMSALTALPAKTTQTKKYQAAVAAAKKSKGTVTSYSSGGKFLGFDVKAGKATTCVFTDTTTGRWLSSPATCKQYFFAVRTPAEQAKSAELGKLGAEIMMKALSLAAQNQTTVDAVMAEVIASSTLPADVSCELVNGTLTLRSSLFPNVRSNIIFKG